MLRTLDPKRYEQLKTSGSLPSPRGVALAIIRLAQREEISMAELAGVVKGDPAFVGRLIKAANGVVALTRRPVVSVQEALRVLGLPTVRTMALGFSILSSYRRGACRSFDYDLFWSRSLVMALAAQVFAQHNRAGVPEELFSLGLLADVGRLALATLYPCEYDQLLAEARRDPELRLCDLERRAFAMTHTELGAAMLGDWGVPQVLIEPVCLYETPENLDCEPGTRTCMLLNTLVLGGMMADLCHAPDESEAKTIAARMIEPGAATGLPSAELASAGEHIAALWLEWCGALQLEPPEVPDFKALLGQGSGLRTLRMPQPVYEESPEKRITAEEDERAAVRVLVVENDAGVRAGLCAVLEKNACVVHEAADGQSGMESALEWQPDVLVCAAVLPGMDGLELIRALRATRMGRNLYILLLTDVEEDEELIEAFESGVDDFIARPLNPRVLAARMRAALRVVHLQQKLEHEHEETRRFAAELAVSNRRLQEAALTDALTGFPNRRYAIERMEQEWRGSSRSGRPLSCMIVDVDRFKQINDTFGHDAGDVMLRAAADALRGALRGQDVVCRTGGDEFLVICPDTDLQSALTCSERLRRAVDALAVRIGDQLIRMSISIGVAVREAAMADLDALIKQADLGLYHAKHLGRNRAEAVQLHGCGNGC